MTDIIVLPQELLESSNKIKRVLEKLLLANRSNFADKLLRTEAAAGPHPVCENLIDNLPRRVPGKRWTGEGMSSSAVG